MDVRHGKLNEIKKDFFNFFIAPEKNNEKSAIKLTK